MAIDGAQPSGGVAIDLFGEMRRGDIAALTAGHRLGPLAEGDAGDEAVAAAEWRCFAPDMRLDRASSVSTRVAD